jgi:hypothetical protein
MYSSVFSYTCLLIHRVDIDVSLVEGNQSENWHLFMRLMNWHGVSLDFTAIKLKWEHVFIHSFFFGRKLVFLYSSSS